MDIKKFLELSLEAELTEAKKKKETTAQKDKKAEKAGKEVAKDIEHDEGHKGKDDDKAEKAGKKVTKDIEYDDKKDKKKKSLKDWFEKLDKEIISELNITGMKPVPVLDPKTNKAAGAGVLTSKNPSVQNILKNLDPKEVQVVQTTTGSAPIAAGSTTTAPVGGTAAVKEENVMEKAPPGMEDMVMKLKKQYPGHPEKAFATAWSIYNKKHGKKDESALEEAKKWIQKAIKKPGALKKQLGVPADEKIPAGKLAAAAKKGGKLGQRARLAQTLKGMHEAEIPQDGAQNSPLSHVVREAAKPDFLDLDKDGNKKESMKKAAQDAKKKKTKVKESMNTLEAAYHEGKAHGLGKHSYACRYDEGSPEHHRYHAGYKEGLDECMGVRNEPIVGIEETMPATVPGMASQAMPTMPAMEDELDEVSRGEYLKQQDADAERKGKTEFTAFGQKFSTDDIPEAFAFEALDKQLNDLLNESTQINEGLTVSMSTGNEGSPDSVSVSGTDAEAAQLLAFIKQVGLGGMGSEAHAAQGEPEAEVVSVSDYGAPKFTGHDNPDMKSLLQKVGAGDDDEEEGGEEETDEGATCKECGMEEAKCGCEKEPVEEVETKDQATYEMAEGEGSAPDDSEGTVSAASQDAERDAALAAGDQTERDVHEDASSEASSGAAKGVEVADDAEETEAELNEWANNAGQKGTDTAFEQDIEFMTKIISGGLNKPKVTGQTTIPVIAGQDARDGTNEDLASWLSLAGIKK